MWLGIGGREWVGRHVVSVLVRASSWKGTSRAAAIKECEVGGLVGVRTFGTFVWLVRASHCAPAWPPTVGWMETASSGSVLHLGRQGKLLVCANVLSVGD